MKKLAVCVAVVAAVLMIGNTAMAFNFADHVKASTNGKGDVLLFPFYAAFSGGYETKLTVINTAQDRSVVAKVVVRSAFYTQELLDFLIYLSPTDVWTGTIRFNNGRVEFYSNDDSQVSAVNADVPTWASTTPVMQPLVSAPNLRCNDTNNYGYVEVFESAHSMNGSTFSPAAGTAPVSLNIPPVNKNALFRAYAALPTRNNPAPPTITLNPTVGLVLDGINVLTGVMEFKNDTINQKSALQATALRDYGATLANGLGGTALTVQDVTSFAEQNNAFNWIGEVEAALAKNDLALYYSDRYASLHLLTFPTKMTQLPAAPACSPLNNPGTVSPYFQQRPLDAAGCIPYTSAHYDLTEMSASASAIFSPATQGSLCHEVNIVPNSGFAFSQGWARYTLPSPTAFWVKDPLIVGNAVHNVNAALNTYDGTFTGAPVLGTILHLGMTNDGFTTASGAYTDGLVTSFSAESGLVAGGPINYYYFQVQDERNTGTASYNGLAPTPLSSNIGYDANRPAAADPVAAAAVENQTRGVPQGANVSLPPTTADTHHPIQSAAPDQQ